MSFSEHFPIYSKLSAREQEILSSSAFLRTASRGTLIHNGALDCLGLILVRSGQLRAYFTSDEGKEITLYRLFDRDICMLTASCVMSSIQFEIMITAEKDTQFWIVPPYVYKKLMEQSAVVANYTNELMATRLTDVMWVMEQVLWKSFDRRLAQFLLQEQEVEGTSVLKLTHEVIASHLGTAREVVTRMLKYFQTEGLVRLTRGTVELTDLAGLQRLESP